MAETISFTRPDGKSTPGWFTPVDGAKGAVVLIQEWWGINPQMKGVAARLAEAGFTSLTPDLYRGRIAATGDEAQHMMEGLDWPDATHQDLAGAAAHLRGLGCKVAALGFCMGGALTIAAGVHVDLDAAVCFYGIPPQELANPGDIRVPILFHFAQQDDWCSPEAVDALEQTLRADAVPYTLHRYPAQHAFFNEARPEVYDAEASALAWERSIEFLRRELK